MTPTKMLRSGRVDERRFYTIEAGPLNETNSYEAWFACGYLTRGAGVGTTSECLRVAKTVAELEEWANSLDDAAVRALADEHCP